MIRQEVVRTKSADVLKRHVQYVYIYQKKKINK